jgi:hypothetical protein
VHPTSASSALPIKQGGTHSWKSVRVFHNSEHSAAAMNTSESTAQTANGVTGLSWCYLRDQGTSSAADELRRRTTISWRRVNSVISPLGHGQCHEPSKVATNAQFDCSRDTEAEMGKNRRGLHERTLVSNRRQEKCSQKRTVSGVSHHRVLGPHTSGRKLESEVGRQGCRLRRYMRTRKKLFHISFALWLKEENDLHLHNECDKNLHMKQWVSLKNA